MRGSIAALAACLLLLALAVAGCGGGGDGGTTSGGGGAATTEAGGGEGEPQGGGESSEGSQKAKGPVSEAKSDFVAKANDFCEEQLKQLSTQLQQLLGGGNGPQKPAAQQAALNRFAEDAIGPAMRAEAEELKALGAPEGDEEQVEAIIASLEAIATKTRKDPKGLVNDVNAFDKAQTLTKEYGLDACGRVA